MQTETKTVTRKKETKGDLQLSEDVQGAWGTEESTAADIIIPKLLLMHGQSELVLTGKKTQGELIRSTDHETLATRGGTIKVIPFRMMKTWRVSEIVGGQAEWRREEAWTPENTDLAWEFEENGKEMRRDQAYNFYCILADGGGEGLQFPMKMQFTRTSRRAGRIIADHFAMCKMMRKPPATVIFEIGSEFVNGDKQKYFIFTAKASGQSTLEQVKICKQWWDLMSQSSASVKDHEVSEKTEVLSEDQEY
jgi:hypothetical protein